MKYDWKSMTPRERDALVAKQAMGYECHVDEADQKVSWVDRSFGSWQTPPFDWVLKWDGKLPPYTTDIAAAWEVVKRMDAIRNYTFVRLMSVPIRDITPELICRTALISLGVDI